LSEKLPGYRGEALRVLKQADAAMGDLIRVFSDGKEYEGTLIPRSELGDDEHIVIKLKNGYNIGIKVTQETTLKKTGESMKPAFSAPPLPDENSSLPRIVILSTGGTIASRVDYRTGGVRPALTASDLYSVVPELSTLATIEAEIFSSVFSENISPKDWSQIARKIAEHARRGVAGIVVAHGTDTMGYTAAALSFALQELPVPVVLVGAQRSADRPSSDAATNLIGAVRAAAEAPFAEVVVAMHETTSDQTIVFHRGVKVRKCHTSRRDAFKSINAHPLAKLEKGRISMLTSSYRERDMERRLVLKPVFEEKVALLKFHPGLNPRLLDYHVDNGVRGVVLEGTGLGHVSSSCIHSVQRAVKGGVVVGMTSQCLWGRVNLNVYETGRDLLEAGVIPLGDMLPETALVKMMWVLGQTEKAMNAEKLLEANMVGELSDRSVLEESPEGWK
jgi:glutamyl-tRNA(Gln) amidotransferase subunit D